MQNGKIFIPASPLPGLRVGVAGRGAGIIYGDDLPAIRERERNLLMSITGLPAERIVFLNQVHGDECLIMRNVPDEAALYAADADAVVTDVPDLCIVIRTADCVPVFLHHPGRGVLAAVHSGWKGTLAEIAGKAVRIMKDELSCDPTEIRALILPSIGPGTYQVGHDVADLFPGYVIEKQGFLYLDLWRRIEDTLEAEGIGRGNISNTGICNLTGSGEFYSHRGGDTGRNLNFAYIIA